VRAVLAAAPSWPSLSKVSTAAVASCVFGHCFAGAVAAAVQNMLVIMLAHHICCAMQKNCLARQAEGCCSL
jgi:hypothetical protein